MSLADSWRLDRVYISESEKEISQLGIENSSAVLHPPGIVVLSRDAGVGKSAITTCSMAVSRHFICWHCGPRLDNRYLYYWFQHRKREFENIATTDLTSITKNKDRGGTDEWYARTQNAEKFYYPWTKNEGGQITGWWRFSPAPARLRQSARSHVPSRKTLSITKVTELQPLPSGYET